MIRINVIAWHTGNARLQYKDYISTDYCMYLFISPTKICIDGKEIHTDAYSLIVYEPGTVQNFSGVDEHWCFDLIHFDGEEVRQIIEALHIPTNSLFQVSDPLYITSLFKKITRETIRLYDFRDITLDIMLRNLLLKIGIVYKEFLIGSSCEEDEYAGILNEIRSELLAHPEHNWNVHDIAKKYNLSVSFFRRLYFKHYGISPKNDLIELRIRRAEYLMNCEGLSVRAVARAVGYKDEGHFIRLFKQRRGVSPGEFVMNHQGGNVIGN